jgi:hypothetical protein
MSTEIKARQLMNESSLPPGEGVNALIAIANRI